MLMGLGPPAIKLGAKMTPEEVTALLKSLEKPARKRKPKAKPYLEPEPVRKLISMTAEEIRASGDAVAMAFLRVAIEHGKADGKIEWYER